MGRANISLNGEKRKHTVPACVVSPWDDDDVKMKKACLVPEVADEVPPHVTTGSIESPPNATRQASKKKVHFRSKLVSHQDYSAARSDDSTWYSSSDYRAFNKDCVKTISHVAHGRSVQSARTSEMPLKPDQHTVKGLEDVLSKKGKQYKDYLKLRHREHVMTECRLQKSNGFVDEHQLSSVSQTFSLENWYVALERGHVDVDSLLGGVASEKSAPIANQVADAKKDLGG